MLKHLITLALGCILPLQAVATDTPSAMTEETNTSQTRIEMKTSLGDLILVLYNDTPAHRDNFIKLVGEGYYDGVLFHRVIRDFMAQTGDPTSRDAQPGQILGEGDPGYTIPAEFRYPTRFHKRGAIAAARTADELNPQKESSGSQFYIVTGKVYTDQQLSARERQANRELEQQIVRDLNAANRDTIMAMRRAHDFNGLRALQDEIILKAEAQAKEHPFAFPAEVRAAYTTAGGIPHLDGEYTVFGEVIEGMDVIDRLSEMETDRFDRPVEDVRILEMKVIE